MNDDVDESAGAGKRILVNEKLIKAKKKKVNGCAKYCRTVTHIILSRCILCVCNLFIFGKLTSEFLPGTRICTYLMLMNKK